MQNQDVNPPRRTRKKRIDGRVENGHHKWGNSSRSYDVIRRNADTVKEAIKGVAHASKEREG